jgi:hypothetical protein
MSTYVCLFGLVERFKGGRTNVDDACSGRLLTVTCVEVKRHIEQRIRDN